MQALITGAFGRVGTALIDHLPDEYELVLFDRQDHPDFEPVIGDVSSAEAVADACAGVDAIVHLAAASRVDAAWPAVLESNLIGAYNCFEAARRHEVETVVFASTNHVVGTYETEHAPALSEPDYDLVLDASTPVRPDSLYGTSKVFGEALGRYYAENHEYPRRVYAIRFGSVRSPAYDHPYGDAERGVERGEWTRDSAAYEREVRRMKATWHSRRDAAALVDACLADETVVYDIFYGTSDNERSWFDIDHARDVLGYEPADCAGDWDEPPASGTRPVDDATLPL